MSFVNNYAPPPPRSPVVLPDPTQPYDVVPFVPWIHAKAVFSAIDAHPQVMHYMPWNTFPTQHAFEVHCEASVRADPSLCLFVILNKEKMTPETEEDPEKVGDILMGTIAYCNSSRPLATVEIGFIIILPPYQRTHVSSHAIGLMMRYALDLPKDGGLGIRRCMWQAHASNAPSIKAGKRMGFQMEGIIRWQRPLPAGKESSAPFRADDSLGVPGRHSAMLAVCWDDWENGAREHVKALIERRT